MDQAPDEAEAEARLVRRAVREPQAFGLIYERFYPVILNYTFRRTLSVAAAEELTSNTFFKALRALPKYRCDRPIRSWLYQIATNELRMHWRWRRRHPVFSLGDADALERVSFDSCDAPAAHEEFEQRMTDFARLHRALARLPHRYQTVLALRYFESLTLEQIAQVIGRPLGSVKSRLHRATAKLRKILEPSPANGIEPARTSL